MLFKPEYGASPTYPYIADGAPPPKGMKAPLAEWTNGDFLNIVGATLLGSLEEMHVDDSTAEDIVVPILVALNNAFQDFLLAYKIPTDIPEATAGNKVERDGKIKALAVEAAGITSDTIAEALSVPIIGLLGRDNSKKLLYVAAEAVAARISMV